MICMIICFKRSINIETGYKNRYPSAFADERAPSGPPFSFGGIKGNSRIKNHQNPVPKQLRFDAKLTDHA